MELLALGVVLGLVFGWMLTFTWTQDDAVNAVLAERQRVEKQSFEDWVLKSIEEIKKGK